MSTMLCLFLQIGVTTGYLTKLITGRNTLDQYAAAPLPVILTFVLFITVCIQSTPPPHTPPPFTHGYAFIV